MHWPTTIVAGLKAAFFGSLIGTSIPLLFTMYIGITFISEDAGAGLLVMILPMLIAFPAALIALAIFGLPLSLWLQKRGAESRSVYLSAGAIAGGVMPAIILWFWLGAFGLVVLIVGAAVGVVTGSMTGMFWWRYARAPLVEGGTADWAEVFE